MKEETKNDLKDFTGPNPHLREAVFKDTESSQIILEIGVSSGEPAIVVSQNSQHT